MSKAQLPWALLGITGGLLAGKFLYSFAGPRAIALGLNIKIGQLTDPELEDPIQELEELGLE